MMMILWSQRILMTTFNCLQSDYQMEPKPSSWSDLKQFIHILDLQSWQNKFLFSSEILFDLKR